MYFDINEEIIKSSLLALVIYKEILWGRILIIQNIKKVLLLVVKKKVGISN